MKRLVTVFLLFRRCEFCLRRIACYFTRARIAFLRQGITSHTSLLESGANRCGPRRF
jgi:hypothetical protein